jgi:membrane-bound serine protease (ClpP class)
VNVRRVFFLLAFIVGLVLDGARVVLAQPAVTAPQVIVVPVHGTIDEATAHLVERSIAEAEARRARAVVLDIDTHGGLVSAATEIRDAELRAPIPVDAYVRGRALNAGALIALAAARLEMAPGSAIGAAAPIPATVDNVSALRTTFAATALRRGRNAAVATAMVDADAPAMPYTARGTVLTLHAADAVHAGIANGIAPNLDAALVAFRLGDAKQVAASYTLGERLERFATSPDASGVLLALGFLGLLIEMQTLHGIAGTLGAGALAVFFGTHAYAGFGDGLVVALAIAGTAGILLELHVVPGHGVFGVGGVVALIVAVFLAFQLAFFWSAVQALAIAIVLTALAYMILVRYFPENAFMRRFAFTGVQGADYVTASDSSLLVGMDGFATSYLRPAGVATVGGQRIDVLTDGDFVTAGTAVRVVRVEGSRIFVEAIHRNS